MQQAGAAAPAPGLSRADRLAVYAATARVMLSPARTAWLCTPQRRASCGWCCVLRAWVRLITTEHHPPAADLAIWRSYPECATAVSELLPW